MSASLAVHMRRRRQTPVILQSEAADCAHAALCMIATRHGHALDLLAIRQRFGATLKGCTVGDLVTMGQTLGLDARPLRLEPVEMRELRRPAVLHWRMNHFVVLVDVHRRGIDIHDPATGRRRVPWAEVGEAFTGIAVEFTPGADFRAESGTHRIGFTPLWRSLPGLGRFATTFFLVCMLAQGVALTIPYLFQLVIDEVLVSHDTGLLFAVVLGLALLMTFEALINALRSWAVAVVSAQLTRAMTWSLTRHLLALALPFFERRHTGDLLTRLASLDSVQSILAHSVVGIAVDGTVVLLTAAVMLACDTTLGLLAIGMLLLLSLLRLALYPYQRDLEDRLLQQQAREQTHVIETLRTITSIRVANGESRRLQAWSSLLTSRINASLDVIRFQVGSTLFESLLQGALHITIIWFAAQLVMTEPHRFSIGMLFAFMAWKNQFSERSGTLVGHVLACRLLDLHLQRLGDIALEPAAVDDGRTGTAERLRGDIVLQNLGFRHAATETWVLRGLDLHIRSGEMVAIVGLSGSGKTTLVKLLLGLYTPVEGNISIGGVPLVAASAPLWRRETGTVLQEDQLVSGTVADNIAFLSGDMDLERVEQAAALAGLHEAVRRLPMGYLSLVGDLGSTLSSGQKQRLLIARALYRRPEALILDEGSAHLDPVTEMAIGEVLAAIPCTRIVIAHRPDWVNRANRVFELADGRLHDVTAQRSVITGRLQDLDLPQQA